MTTSTLSQNEILEALSQMQPADICKLVAAAARGNQKKASKEASQLERQSEQEDSEEEYDRLQEQADGANRVASQWEDLADTMKGMARDLR